MLQDNELVKELIDAAKVACNHMCRITSPGEAFTKALERLDAAIGNLPGPPGRLADPALADIVMQFTRCNACTKTPSLFLCSGCAHNASVIERLHESVRKAVDALLVYRDLPKDHWPGPPTTSLDELAPVRQWTEECKLQLSECPFPELDGLSVQNKVLSSKNNVTGIGNMSWNPHHRRWQCLANVSGMLCLVELSVRGTDGLAIALNTFEVYLKEKERAANPS